MLTRVSNLATAKLKTVAVRFPKNKVLRQILKSLNFPLAIPSANKSSHISPVTAEDVAQEFKSSLKIILNDGPCKIGLESTVIDLTSKPQSLNMEMIVLLVKNRICVLSNKPESV